MDITDYGVDHGCIGHTYLLRADDKCIATILLGEAIPWKNCLGSRAECRSCTRLRLAPFLHNPCTNKGCCTIFVQHPFSYNHSLFISCVYLTGLTLDRCFFYVPDCSDAIIWRERFRRQKHMLHKQTPSCRTLHPPRNKTLRFYSKYRAWRLSSVL